MNDTEQIARSSTPASGVFATLRGLLRVEARLARVGALAAVIALLAVALPATAGAESCPNEEVRAEQGATRLPDCRAFELVTPEIKGDSGNFGGNPYGFPDGDHVYYFSVLPMPGAASGGLANMLSTRTASGWVNASLAPPATGPGSPAALLPAIEPNSGGYAASVAFTGNFSQAFVESGFDSDPLDQDYAVNEEGAHFRGTFDAYREDLSSGAWSLAALPDTGAMLASFNAAGNGRGTFIEGVSEDGSRVFFNSFDQLPVAPGTPSESHPGDMVYERSGGHTYMVGVLPGGDTVSQTCETVLGDGAKDAVFQAGHVYGAISPDGTNVVFTTRAPNGVSCPSEGVYLRENNGTLDATTIQLAGVGFVARSSDGSKVFTDDGIGGVFEYDVATGVTSTISLEGEFVASSADGSRVYYLTRGGPKPGLYLWDNGTSVLIPRAGEGFASEPVSSLNGSVSITGQYAVATADGSRLLFLDAANLTSYNQLDNAEAYVYDAETGAVTCVSCNPTGAPPLGSASLTTAGDNALIPQYSEGELSPDGSRVFFETIDALVPQDTNGLSDVYEWEDGRVYLISSGQGTGGALGTGGSHLSGVSSNGDDVFITTTDRLAPQDSESSKQIYDARVDGGFPYRPFVPGCQSGQCQGPQTPAPSFGAPASATFMGSGNPLAVASAPVVDTKPKATTKKCKKGFVKKRNKCVRKKTSKTAKRASANRGAKSHA